MGMFDSEGNQNFTDTYDTVKQREPVLIPKSQQGTRNIVLLYQLIVLKLSVRLELYLRFLKKTQSN